jgi:3D (Asp-Asp-Asp) domain-containing protein
MRSSNTLCLLASTIAAAALGLGCLGNASESTDRASDETAGGEIAVRPGHGNASMPGQDLSKGDKTNAFDSTDDPSDPDFTPTKSPRIASDGEVAQSEEALSTSYGTTFDLTYYVISLRPSTDRNEVTIRDCQGNFLTYASRAWRDDAVMQGTARFKTSSGVTKTINAGQGCWITLPYEQRWGLGVTNPATNNSFNLRPFRSIAVDRNVLTIGKWYYIKELDGVQMPYPASTMVHDGCVRAVDVGPAIQGRHIDFFSGYYSAYEKLIQGTSTMGGKEQISLYSGTYKCATHIERGY